MLHCFWFASDQINFLAVAASSTASLAEAAVAGVAFVSKHLWGRRAAFRPALDLGNFRVLRLSISLIVTLELVWP
jgi:hypothetical protein